MSQSFKISREVLDSIEQYRQELLSLADERIESLRQDLQCEEEWRTWCAKAIPFDIYSKQQELIAREVRQRQTASLHDVEYKNRIKSKNDNKFLIIALIVFSISVIAGLEWYTSTSYGNFCYRIGHHIVSTLVGVPIVGGVIWASMWFTGELRSK